MKIKHEQEIIEAESTIDTLVQGTEIYKTKSYKLFRQALTMLQKELEAIGIKGKW